MAKGITFCAPMVLANRAGRKSQTRLLVKPQPNEPFSVNSAYICDQTWNGVSRTIQARYQPGDVVYVKESFTHWGNSINLGEMLPRSDVAYHADNERREIEWPGKSSLADLPVQKWWNTGKPLTYKQSPIHMPAWAARDWIKILSVRVERLQEISEADAKAEGVRGDLHISAERAKRHGLTETESDYRLAYAELIDSIHGPGTWESNPFVWVYGFEKAEAAKETQ